MEFDLGVAGSVIAPEHFLICLYYNHTFYVSDSLSGDGKYAKETVII